MATVQKLPNGGRITFFTKDVLKSLGVAQKDAMMGAGYLLSNKVKTLMASSPRTGRIYRVGKTPTKGDRKAGLTFRAHRSSGPGEPPAPNTGRLMGSVKSWAGISTIFGWETRVGTDVKYAKPLEEGVKRLGAVHLTGRTTKDGRQIARMGPVTQWKLAPRPSWIRALREEWPKIVLLFRAASGRIRIGGKQP